MKSSHWHIKEEKRECIKSYQKQTNHYELTPNYITEKRKDLRYLVWCLGKILVGLLEGKLRSSH